MKKLFLKHWVIFIPLFAVVFFSACDKEDAKDIVTTEAFNMTSETHPRIHPIAPMEIKEQPGLIGYAHATGGGTGKETNMGDIKNWFNQLVFSPTGADPPTGTALAPVADALNYPVLGGPMPLIQENDFDEFRTANEWLKVPVTVGGNVVNSVIYNDKGDAVFTSLTTNAEMMAVSPTRVNFSAEGKFVGGRGKYLNATGTYKQTGYFNPQNFDEAAYFVEGTISY